MTQNKHKYMVSLFHRATIKKTKP